MSHLTLRPTSHGTRLRGVVVAASILVAACSAGGAPTSAPTGGPTDASTPAATDEATVEPTDAATAAPTDAATAAPTGDEPSPAPTNPYDGAEPGSGEGMKVGYISLGESLPFVKLVSESIREQADIAGLELVFCDSQVDAAKALDCARNLAVQDVEAVLNFNAFADSSAEICAAYGDLPTIAIDIVQEPCQVAFMGADNRFAGYVAGQATGAALKAENGCEYEALLTLESPQVGEVNTERVNGMLEGFAEECGEIPEGKHRPLGVGGTTDQALTQVGDALSAIAPGGIVVVLSLNDDMALGALGAARTAGREDELRIGAQGADPSAWEEIACNPVWLADAAYFPERYGTILIPAVIDILEGEEVPETLYTPHEAITKDNIREVYPETPSC